MPALAHVAAPARARRPRSLARRTAAAVGNAVSDVMENDALAAGPGLMQGLDPRVRLAAVLLFAVTASLVHSLPVLLALVAATAALAAASRVPLVSFARKLAGSAGVFAVLLAAPAVTGWISPGAALVGSGAASVTAPGLLVASRLVARVIAGAGPGLLVVWTTRWPDLLQALGALGVPDVVVATLAMTQKQIVSLLRTVENVHLARESRMLGRGPAREERRWVVERMAFVARKSMKTADDVYDAMLARGFDGRVRTLARLRAGARDAAWALAGIALCAAAIGVDRAVFPL